MFTGKLFTFVSRLIANNNKLIKKVLVLLAPPVIAVCSSDLIFHVMLAYTPVQIS